MASAAVLKACQVRFTPTCIMSNTALEHVSVKSVRGIAMQKRLFVSITNRRIGRMRFKPAAIVAAFVSASCSAEIPPHFAGQGMSASASTTTCYSCTACPWALPLYTICCFILKRPLAMVATACFQLCTQRHGARNKTQQIQHLQAKQIQVLICKNLLKGKQKSHKHHRLLRMTHKWLRALLAVYKKAAVRQTHQWMVKG